MAESKKQDLVNASYRVQAAYRIAKEATESNAVQFKGTSLPPKQEPAEQTSILSHPQRIARLEAIADSFKNTRRK
jgi:hypothetical protein